MLKGKGFILDKENNRYKTYVSFLGIEFGEWKKLLNFKFVAITERQGTQKLNAPRTFSASSTVKFPLFCIYLCIDKKRKILLYKSKGRSELETIAQKISKYLGIDLINYIKSN